METLTLKEFAITFYQPESHEEYEADPNAHVPVYVELFNRILRENGECLIVESQVHGDAPFTDAQKEILANFFLRFATWTEESSPAQR